MRILSLNVNGFRSAVKHGLWDLIVDQCIDVACFQEIKGTLVPSEHSEYILPEFVGAISPISNHFGVGTMADQSIQLLTTNLKKEQHVFRGRLVGTQLENGVQMWNVYAPTIMANEIEDACIPFWKTLIQCSERWVKKPGIICGDFNLIGSPLDIHPSLLKSRKKTIETQYYLYNQLLSQGWIDCWRQCHSDSRRYTYWSKQPKYLRTDNRGLRLDYVLCSPSLQSSIVKANIIEVDSKISDHASVVVEFNFPNSNEALH